MNFLENIINAITTIFTNKLRSSLTMLGIVIGVSSVIVMIAIGQGAQRGVTSRIQQLGTNLLVITPGSSTQTNVRGNFGGSSSTDSLTNGDFQVLQKLEGILAVSPEVSGRKQVIYKNNNVNTTITGVLPTYEIVRNFNIDYGQFISEQNNVDFQRVAIVGQDIVTNLFNGENPIGQDVRVENNIFTIIGVMEKKGQQGFRSADDVIFIPLYTAQKRVFGDEDLSTIYVSVKNADEMETMMEEVNYTLLKEHELNSLDEADFTVLNQADAIETMNEVTKIFTILLGGIAGISLLVGGIGVMNIMLVSVTERTREIGIRKAIGAKEKDILLQFLTESTILSIVGGMLGVIISFLVVMIIKSKLSMDTNITFNSIILAFIFSASVGIFFGAFPAFKAGKLKPIEALRFE